MDLNLWTEDFFLPQDLGLDLLADPQDGQYDDLKDKVRLIGDYKHNQREDVVEQLSTLSQSQSSLDDNDMGWMESDVGSLLDALASHQQELSFPPELFDMTSSLPTDSVSQTVFNDILNTGVCLSVITDSNITPPDSPEQVLPEILLEEHGHKSSDLSPSSSSISHFLLPGGKELFKNEFDTDCSEPLKTELHTLQDAVDFLHSPLSANEVESMLSSPEPASPQSPNSSALILSSPELYKVIAAPSNISNRYSPYSKQKDTQKAKSTKSRTRKLKSEPEPDILFLSEDSSNLNKKDRKRLQNKNAAIRYRQKKKDEAETVHTEVGGLEDRNQELKTKVEDLEREVRYMKNLMQDIQKAKGVSL